MAVVEHERLAVDRFEAGLDGVRSGDGKTRLKSIDGEAFVLDDGHLLTQTD